MELPILEEQQKKGKKMNGLLLGNAFKEKQERLFSTSSLPKRVANAGSEAVE
jgi:hypothetical protein